MNTINQVTPRSAGALTFSPDGVLFLGDNKLGAVFAFETERGQAPASLDPFLFESIDEKIAAALGVTAKSLVMNGMAVHPVTREPYLAVGVRNGDRLEPAVVSVSLAGEVHPFDLSSSKVTVHQLSDVPDEDKTFQVAGRHFPIATGGLLRGEGAHAAAIHDDRGPEVSRRRGVRRRRLEPRVLLHAAADPLPVHRGRQRDPTGDLPPRPRHIRNACADPDHAVRHH